MFRMGLLTSTAMTAAALLLSGASAQAQTNMHVASRDPNTRFLCTYGQFHVDAFWARNGSQLLSSWSDVAVSLKGHGQTVSRIKVIEAVDPSESSIWSFSAGIYSSTRHGHPGSLIAGGKGRAGPSCGPVTITIPPTTLTRNTKYWIVEKTPKPNSSYSYISLFWEASPKTKREAFVRRHSFYASASSYVSSSYTSPWIKQTEGPSFELK